MKKQKKLVDSEKDETSVAGVADDSKKIRRRKKIKKKKQFNKRNKYLHLVLNKIANEKTNESSNHQLQDCKEQIKHFEEKTSRKVKKQKKSIEVIKLTKDETDENYDEEKMEDLRKNVKLIIEEFGKGEKKKKKASDKKLKKNKQVNRKEKPNKREKISQDVESHTTPSQCSDDEMQTNQNIKIQRQIYELNSSNDSLEGQSNCDTCAESETILQENDQFRVERYSDNKRSTALFGSEEILQRSQSLKQRMLNKLKGSQFRYLNEKMYTTTGKEAKEMFGNNRSMFQEYHAGYQNQVSKWPVNPLQLIIKDIQSRPPSLVIADFGCGDASLAKNVSNKVHSFDLVALNEHVTVCNMAKVPLRNEEVDIVVFCLSLMGTNLSDYIKEAHRVLKMRGRLIIAEVESRFQNIGTFVKSIEKHGFHLLKKNEEYKMFVLFEFQKSQPMPKKVNCELYLKPCLYKKR